MRRGVRITLLIAGASLILGSLAAAPAMAAAQTDLRVTRANCAGVAVTATGLPANQTLFLLVTDVSTGKALGGGPSPVRTSASGEVRTQRSLPLAGVRTVDVSIWTKKGETLTMAARDKSSTNCGSAAEAAATGLPRTGASPGRGLLVGGVLLLGGVALLWRTRGTRRTG
jgi:LPXTG-motif cell wall-anchored protein